MRPCVRRLTLSVSFLLIWIGLAGAAQNPPRGAEAPPKAAESTPNASEDAGGLSFHTLDGDEQQVEVNEIWRIRDATGVDEPAGSVLIDYAFERLYVKDTLENVVDKIRQRRKVERYTLPSGKPVYIVTEKVIGIMRAIPGQHHEKSKSLLIAREGQQQVQESREAVREALKR